MPNGLAEQSLLELTRDLVRIPSRAGFDSCGPVYARVVDWLQARGIATEILFDGEVPLAATATVGEPRLGPTYLLIATADTAEFGDESVWTFEPLSGQLRDGWLYGRGSADSKSGIRFSATWRRHWLPRRASCMALSLWSSTQRNTRANYWASSMFSDTFQAVAILPAP